MDPKEIITDEESQALREPAPPGGEPVGGPLVPTGQIQDLHADHWERILANRAPALESIAERMCSLLKATGRKFFRASVDVVAHPIQSVRWGAYVRQLQAPTSLNLLDIKPSNLKGVITLNAAFVFVLVDVFFGGDGKGERPEEMIEFTPMEQRLLRKFVEAITADLKQAWKPFAEMDFGLGKAETNPIFAGVATSSETVSVARFGIVLGDRELPFEVVLPSTLVEPLRSLQGSAQAEGSAGLSQKWRNRLREDIQEARVAMRAVLSGSEINLRDIALAQPGDVIATDLPVNVVLYAGDKPLLEGTFGVFQGRNAVRISKPVNRRMLGEQYGRSKDE